MTETLNSAKELKAEMGEYFLLGSGWGALEEKKRAAEGGKTLSADIVIPDEAMGEAH